MRRMRRLKDRSVGLTHGPTDIALLAEHAASHEIPWQQSHLDVGWMDSDVRWLRGGQERSRSTICMIGCNLMEAKWNLSGTTQCFRKKS